MQMNDYIDEASNALNEMHERDLTSQDSVRMFEADLTTAEMALAKIRRALKPLKASVFALPKVK